MSRLAIIDWGIGGVGVRTALHEISPDLRAIYFSDTGARPYGKMGRAELSQRLDNVVAHLMGLGVSHILVGCNAASTAIDDLRVTDVVIEGIINAAVDLAMADQPIDLGIIGGRRTILSRAYSKKLAAAGVRPQQRIAQPLSAFIENGDLGSDEVRKACKTILKPLRNCSHILLACTHYSAVRDVMAEFVSRDTKFLDPAPALASMASSWDIERGGTDRYLTTGDPEQMKRSAYLAFGWKIDEAEVVSETSLNGAAPGKN